MARSLSCSTLLNSVQNHQAAGSKSFVCESIYRRMHNADTIVITAPDVCECLKIIKLSKAAGLDGLAAEHHDFFCTVLFVQFVFIAYECVNSWAFAFIFNEICYCPIAIVTAISKKKLTMPYESN